MEISVILANTNRARAYLQNLIRLGFCPKAAVYLEEGSQRLVEQVDDNKTFKKSEQSAFVGIDELGIEFDQKEQIQDTLEKAQIPYSTVSSVNINAPEVIEAVAQLPTEYVLFAGPGAQLLGPQILAQGKQIFHVHPGALPAYRGSTTYYYAMLQGDKVGASVIIFNEGIDQGPIIHVKEYALKAGDYDIDHVLDPVLRTAVLIDCMKQGALEQEKQHEVQDKEDSANTFYIIHPLLKHLAIDRFRQG